MGDFRDLKHATKPSSGEQAPKRDQGASSLHYSGLANLEMQPSVQRTRSTALF